ncbi:acyl-CoA dehydrogenase family protein [Phytohabitans aurantiacus]|uniref:Acyl-CoA dehydrogenase n=1 Tax=Phytohabitans aurantiacus TaxID=3016789 RepID=A0ABQ5R9N4_9ACTN|nr:acyl-CoA dehydrogenase family protein [Phytohabitans aurantiacus]GLI02607.1 acyl-CoA dehydrogenase [Phytohabitans aurantiacus]
MEFGFSKEQELFRQRVRNLLAEGPVRDGIAALRADPDPEPDARPLYRELGRRGLLAVNWPERYGGGGRGLLDAAITVEEMVRAGVPDTLHVNTIQIVGLFLLMAGTPQQQARYLPRMASGERFATVLYTEPDAGSDLGSLATTAVPDGDGGWRLSGLKIFSLKGHLTDIGLCAARTGPPESRYQGITLFLVDLHAPGVRRSVVASIADEQFSRVELDDVRVPDSDRLGEVDNGWPLVTQALTVERTGLDYYLKAERWLAAACDVLDATTGPEGVDGAVLEEIGRYGAAVNAGRLLAWRVLAGLADGEVDELAAATAKLYTSELAQRIAGWSTARLAGSAGDPRLPAEAADLVEAAYREAPGLTISAGSSEMMLQIVASLALDRLEREARAS